MDKIASTITIRLTQSELASAKSVQKTMSLATLSATFKKALFAYNGQQGWKEDLNDEIEQLEFKIKELQGLIDSIRVPCGLILDKTGQEKLL